MPGAPGFCSQRSRGEGGDPFQPPSARLPAGRQRGSGPGLPSSGDAVGACPAGAPRYRGLAENPRAGAA